MRHRDEDVGHFFLAEKADGEAFAPVMADRRRIVQVLNNLLSNAARHAPESTPIRVLHLQPARCRLPHGETAGRIGHDAGAAHPPPAARPPQPQFRRASV